MKKRFIVTYELIVEADSITDALEKGYGFSNNDYCTMNGLYLNSVREERE